MPAKISPEELQKFALKYFKERNTTYANLRFGQSFMNEFYPSESCPEIFYEENVEMAVNKIIDQYVDLGRDTLLDVLWKT